MHIITYIKVGTTPGRRYGHTLVYSKPFLITFGGNTGSEPANDTWALNVEKSPFCWNLIEVGNKELQRLDRAMFNATDALLRKRTGAVAPEPEVRRYVKSILGGLTTDPSVVREALMEVRDELQGLSDRVRPGVKGGGPGKSKMTAEQRFSQLEKAGVPKEKIFVVLQGEGY